MSGIGGTVITEDSVGNLQLEVGSVNDTECSVLRDTGATICGVRKRLVSSNQYVPGSVQCKTFGGEINVYQQAKVLVVCPYFEGELVCCVLENPVADLIVGNIPGAVIPQIQINQGAAVEIVTSVTACAEATKQDLPHKSADALDENLKGTRAELSHLQKVEVTLVDGCSLSPLLLSAGEVVDPQYSVPPVEVVQEVGDAASLTSVPLLVSSSSTEENSLKVDAKESLTIVKLGMIERLKSALSSPGLVEKKDDAIRVSCFGCANLGCYVQLLVSLVIVLFFVVSIAWLAGSCFTDKRGTVQASENVWLFSRPLHSSSSYERFDFSLRTDSRPLTYLRTSRYKSSRIMRWFIERLGRLRVRIRCSLEPLPGTQNVFADLLSRAERDQTIP